MKITKAKTVPVDIQRYTFTSIPALAISQSSPIGKSMNIANVTDIVSQFSLPFNNGFFIRLRGKRNTNPFK